MTDVLKFTKKLFTVGVVATTILWSLGVAALVPSVVNAADDACPTLIAGEVLKVHGKAAFFVLDGNLNYRYFSDGDVYKSWNADEAYGDRTYVTSECLNSLGSPDKTTPQHVFFRPGVAVVQWVAGDQLYVVKSGNVLQPVTAEVAEALHPGHVVRVIGLSDWNWYTLLTDEMTEIAPYEGMLVKNGADTYHVGADMNLRKVTATGMTANHFKPATYDLADITGYTTGLDIDAEESELSDLVVTAEGGTTPDPDETPATTGAVSVSLSATTPASTNLPDGTAFNALLRVNLKAGSEAATITGVTLKKAGYLLATDVTGIDVVDGNDVRHGNVASSFNSDNEVNILFGSNPVTIPANGTVSLTFRVNLSAASTASTLQLALTGLDTTGSVSGLPVSGNVLNVVDGSNAVASSTIAIQSVSGSSGTNLNADPDNFQEVTKFRISESASKEDLEVHKLTLFNYGNAGEADLGDVQLVGFDGTILATAQANGQYITFDLSASPFKIDKGTYKDFTVRLKILGGTTKTIQLVVYNDYDLVVRGADTNAYILAVGSANDSGSAAFPEGSNGSYNKVTISAGTLTFNKATDSPSSAVSPGATNVVLAKYYAKPVGENMELRKVSFGIIQAASALTGNVYVRVNGSNVYSVAASSLAAAGTVAAASLTSYPTLTAGVNNYITVEGSVISTATSGAAYTVNDFDLTEVKKVLSNTIADPTVGVVDGNQIQVNASSMTAKTLATPVARYIVNGTSDFEFANIQLNALTSGEDIRIASLSVSNDGNGTVTNISNLELYDGDEVLTTSNSTSAGAASTTFTFNNPLFVEKGTIKTLVLKGDVTAGTSGTYIYRLAAASATGRTTGTTVTVSPSGAGQTMTLTSGATVNLSLVSGDTGSPATNQVVNVGTKDGTYFAFKITPQSEEIKVRTLKLTASGTAIAVNDVKNLRLYKDDETEPFATGTEMTCTGGTSCTYTWTATDNIFSAPLQPGVQVTVHVKADIGDAGAARLGHDFLFKINATSTDFVGVGASSAAFVVSGTPTAVGATHIVPFNVKLEAVSPAAAGSTVGLNSGAVVGVFKVSNLGTGQISLNTSTFDNNSAATSSMDWVLRASADGGAQSDVSVSAGTAVTSTETAWGNGFIDATINGASARYLTIKTDATAVNYDSHQWSVNALGQFLYSVTEAELGYDENADGDFSDTVHNLYVDGIPSAGTATSRS